MASEVGDGGDVVNKPSVAKETGVAGESSLEVSPQSPQQQSSPQKKIYDEMVVAMHGDCETKLYKNILVKYTNAPLSTS